jgi:adenylate cyclase
MEVAASCGAEVALSDRLFTAAGSACSAFDSGLLEGAFETAIRGRSGALSTRVWHARRPRRPDAAERDRDASAHRRSSTGT